MRISYIIEVYNGQASVEDWVRKFDLVVSSQDVRKPEKVLPLFLLDGAFDVYESLAGLTKEDYGKLKKELSRHWENKHLRNSWQRSGKWPTR